MLSGMVCIIAVSCVLVVKNVQLIWETIVLCKPRDPTLWKYKKISKSKKIDSREAKTMQEGKKRQEAGNKAFTKVVTFEPIIILICTVLSNHEGQCYHIMNIQLWDVTPQKRVNKKAFTASTNLKFVICPILRWIGVVSIIAPIRPVAYSSIPWAQSLPRAFSLHVLHPRYWGRVCVIL